MSSSKYEYKACIHALNCMWISCSIQQKQQSNRLGGARATIHGLPHSKHLSGLSMNCPDSHFEHNVYVVSLSCLFTETSPERID